MTRLEKNAFTLIRRKLAASRADIARMLAVSRPTASTVVQSLIDSGLVIECGKGKSNGGTSPIVLAANNDYMYVVGVDLGYSDSLSAVLLDNSGEIIAEEQLLFSPADINDLTGKIAGLAGKWSESVPIAGTAIAIPGIVDEKNMLVSESINPVYCGNTVQYMLEKNLKMPVHIGNRSRMAAISEAFCGAGDRENDFALISLGVSIGAAFWCNGAIFNGKNSAAGEIRNMYVSGGITFENALAVQNLKNCSIREIAGICAVGLGQLVDIMDIELLILSGRFADFGSDFAPMLEKIMSEKHPVTVRPARYGRFSAARGAAFRMGEIII